MIALFGLSNLTFAKNETPVQDSNITKNMKILLQESGGLKYSLQERYPEYYSMENADMGIRVSRLRLRTLTHLMTIILKNMVDKFIKRQNLKMNGWLMKTVRAT